MVILSGGVPPPEEGDVFEDVDRSGEVVVGGTCPVDFGDSMNLRWLNADDFNTRRRTLFEREQQIASNTVDA